MKSLLIILVLSAAIILGLVGSKNLLVVLSGSMSPAINAGDLVIMAAADKSDIKIGFITKGDANEDPDAQVRKENDIIGKAVLWIPLLGYFVHFAKSFYGFVLLVIIPGTLLILKKYISI